MSAFPRPLLWADRASAIPYIRGGQKQQADALRDFLTVVREHGIDERVRAGEEVYRSKGFVERVAQNSWRVTPEGERWLETQDPNLLVAIFHSQYRYVGELLRELTRASLTHQNLLEIARTEYGLDWNSLDQVRRRTAWLRSAGVIELRFDTTLAVTDAGRDLIGQLDLHPALTADRNDDTRSDVNLPPLLPLVRSMLDAAERDGGTGRRRTWGYVPGDLPIADTCRLLLNIVGSSMSRAQWSEQCKEAFRISESSAMTSIGFLRATGLVETIDFDRFAPTELGRTWLASGTDVDLICLMHARFSFVGELLTAMQATGSVQELSAMAQEFNLSSAETQRRLALFRTAGLAEEVGSRRFRLTALGEAVASELPPITAIGPDTADERASQTVAPSVSQQPGADSHRDVCDELAVAARAASDHRRLERAVASALRLLGFDVEHLGGPGRTDVLAVSPLAGSSRFTMIADAKASARGDVGAFDAVTLREHKEKHGADVVIAVGEKFGDGRTVKRAEEQGVGLLTTSDLCRVIELCASGALGADDLRELFAAQGLISTALLSAPARRGQRLDSIAKAVAFVIAEEAATDDPETGGAVSAQDVYRQLRGRDDAPTKQEIQVVLDLLSGPFIRGIVAIGDRYVLSDHMPIVAARLRHIGVLLGEIDPLTT